MKNKKPPSPKDIFESLALKYGNGERKFMEIKNYRNTCEVVSIRIFPDKNGVEKNRAAIFFGQDDNGYSIVFCSSEPKAGKDCMKITELSPSRKSGEPNASFGEQSCGVNRVIRYRSDFDEFDFKAREIALKMQIDVNSMIRDFALSRIPVAEEQTGE